MNLLNSVDSHIKEHNSSITSFVLRFKLEERDTNQFIITPLWFSPESKMVSRKSEVLSEKRLNSEGKRFILSDVQGLKSPRQVVENPVECIEDIKENFASNSSKHTEETVEHEESSCSSKGRRPSKSSVRRSLVSDLDSPPVKQSRICDVKVSDCVVMVEDINTDSDCDSISKVSWNIIVTAVTTVNHPNFGQQS